MLTPELGKALSDIGGFALFILVVLVAAVGLYRRWWVPGWLYDQERQARLVAEAQAERNATALAAVVPVMRRILRAVTRDSGFDPDA